MKKLIKFCEFLYHKCRLSLKVNNLKVDYAYTEKNKAFIKLRNEMLFCGRISEQKDKKYYSLLVSRKTKKNLPFACFLLALDIIIRYDEGRLKIGGPKKEYDYKVKEGDVIAEMGAYMGHYTLYLAKKTGKTGKVVAIEPMDDNLEYLHRNIKLNQLNNVNIVEKGVWEKKQTLTIKREKNDYQSASLTMDKPGKMNFSVLVDSLDNILDQNRVKKVDFMIIQLNGVELKALHGLTKYKPFNIAIAARYGKIQIDIVELLKSRGYRVRSKSKHFIYAKLKNLNS